MWKRIHRLIFAIGIAPALTVSASAQVVSAPITAPGVGWEAQGAGMALTNLDGDPRPELILMAYDNPSGANTFRYRVGFNVNPNGAAQNWNNLRVAPGVGWEGQGAGIAITNLDKNARPELIVVAYDNPSGSNTFRYRVGWNLDSSGRATRWDTSFRAVPGVGWEGQGASVAITNLDDDLRPDLVLMAYDNPRYGNSFRYRVGWNLRSSGAASSWQSYSHRAPGVGWEGQGAGIAMANLDTRGPAFVAMAYDGAGSFRYRIGQNVNENGYAPVWSDFFEVPGVGPVQGADVALHDIDGDGSPELFLMGYQDRARSNRFAYRVVYNFRRIFSNRLRGVYVEVDKLTSVQWPPTWVVRNGTGYSLGGIFNRAGLWVRQVFDENAPDLRAGLPYRDADLKAFFDTYSDGLGDETRWRPVHEAVLTRYVDSSVLGVMYDTGRRRGFAVFANSVGNGSPHMQVTAHELGHALCLTHKHGDAWRPTGALTGSGLTIMNSFGDLGAGWDMGWSAASLHHFYDFHRKQWLPDNGLGFGSCDSLID